MLLTFDTKPYNPRRVGSLDDYLRIHDGNGSYPLFKGYKHYEILWNRGYFIPEVSFIIIMRDIGRENEDYLILEKLKMIWVAGKPGIYNPQRILRGNGPSFEAHNLNPRPKPRK